MRKSPHVASLPLMYCNGMEMQLLDFEVFRAGDYGDKGSFSEADLDALAEYDPKKHEAPIVIGHPETNHPAYGWVQKLKRVGDTIIATAKIVPQLIDGIKLGSYKKRSAAIYRDFQGSGKPYLKHIGFLGGVPPEIKGLADIQLSETDGESVVIEFAEFASNEWKIEKIVEVLQSLRDWMIEKFGLDIANSIVNNWSLDDLKQKAEESGNSIPSFVEKIKEKTNMVTEINFTESQHRTIMDAEVAKVTNKLTTEFSEKAQEDKNKITALETENTALKGQVASFAEKAQATEINAFCDGLVREGKLIPAQRDAKVTLLTKAAKLDAALFAEMKTDLSNSTKVVEFGEDSRIAGAENFSEALTDEDKKMGITAADKAKFKNGLSFTNLGGK